jgi:hypothetical protein
MGRCIEMQFVTNIRTIAYEEIQVQKELAEYIVDQINSKLDSKKYTSKLWNNMTSNLLDITVKDIDMSKKDNSDNMCMPVIKTLIERSILDKTSIDTDNYTLDKVKLDMDDDYNIEITMSFIITI